MHRYHVATGPFLNVMLNGQISRVPSTYLLGLPLTVRVLQIESLMTLSQALPAFPFSTVQ